MDLHSLFEVHLFMGAACGLSTVVFNSWIIHVNAKDWRRGVHLNLPDQILTFLGLNNILWQAVFSFDMSSIQTNLYTSFDQIHIGWIGFMLFLGSTNIWFTAWLSIYYCMKIVNFTSRILLVCKMRISRLLPKLMVGSIVVSFIGSLVSFWNIYPVINHKVIENSTYNLTSEQAFISITPSYQIVAFLGCILPLILTLIPIGLTLSSLWRHLRRMNMNTSDSHQPRTQAHVRAARTMVLLVSLHTDRIISSMYILSKGFNFYDVDVSIFVCWYFILWYSTAQALVLIQGNSKLRKASKGILSPRCHVVSDTNINLH
ncbi:taste receptor type 2 member 40-like [Leptodactylus fuscus]|uniref:taste receptor type 2 member 40-like n=1 Tax=Leptodactylus fuscus TaxID=238119 RepID=UPI003F4EC0A9